MTKYESESKYEVLGFGAKVVYNTGAQQFPTFGSLGKTKKATATSDQQPDVFWHDRGCCFAEMIVSSFPIHMCVRLMGHGPPTGCGSSPLACLNSPEEGASNKLPLVPARGFPGRLEVSFLEWGLTKLL